MSSRTLALSEQLYSYLINASLREPALLREVRLETARLAQAQMQIAPEQGQFMQLLVRLTGARRALEVGTFTGYSSLCVALALPKEGRLIACDVNRVWTDMARGFWAKAGVEHKISLRIAPALETLGELSRRGVEPFDFAFIDADKANYLQYYETVLALMRPGGLIAIDNTLWGGSVADPDVSDADTQAIRTLNRMLHEDDRIDLSLVPIGDGLSLVRKRD